jgi:EmrB/QacA subfamily drug resistance transporter
MASPSPLTRRTILVMLVVTLAQFMQMLDGAVISVALPTMARDFHVSPVAVGFGITVYVLSASIVIPASAWLADRIGSRTVFVSALAAFTITSVMCGSSVTLCQFIAARALQGTSGALMAPVGQLILLRSVERSNLLRVMNMTSAPMLLAPVIGPPLSGLLTTWLGWSWIFYINLAPGVLAIVLALCWFPNHRYDRRPFDLHGFLLNSASLAALLWGIQEIGGTTVPRSITIGAIGAGAVFGAAAVRHALRAKHPLMSLAPLRHITFQLATGLSTIFIRLPITALIFVLPIFLQAGFGMTALLSGLLFLGHSGGDLSMKLFTTRMFRRFGYRAILLASTLGMAISIAAAGLFARTTPPVLIALVLFISGCFRSFLMTGVSTLAFSDVEKGEMASATMLNQVMMQLTTGLGVSISSLVLDLSRVVRNVPQGPPSPTDCRITLVVMAAMALMAIPMFLRLPHDAGTELSGHRASTGGSAQ